MKILNRFLKVASWILLLASPELQAGIAPSLTPQMLEKGKASYTTNCLTCHGEKGDGNGPAGAYMNPKPRNFSTAKFKQGDKPAQVFKSITGGLDGTSMTGYAHLAEDERWGLTYYVLSLRKAGKKK